MPGALGAARELLRCSPRAYLRWLYWLTWARIARGGRVRVAFIEASPLTVQLAGATPIRFPSSRCALTKEHAHFAQMKFWHDEKRRAYDPCQHSVRDCGESSFLSDTEHTAPS